MIDVYDLINNIYASYAGIALVVSSQLFTCPGYQCDFFSVIVAS